MGHRYATPPTCSSGWRYCGEPATLAGRHVAAYLFQNFPSPLLQLFVVVEPEHSGEGRFHHVRLGGAVVETPTTPPTSSTPQGPPVPRRGSWVPKAASQTGTIAVEDAIRAMVTKSANDVAVVVAEAIEPVEP